MANTIKPDLCVLGGSALGLDLAIRAKRRGLDVVLVQWPGSGPDPQPGERLRHATFLASASRTHAIRTASLVGLDNGEPKPNFRSIGEHAAALAASLEPRNTTERLAALGIAMLEGPASFSDRQTLRCGDTIIRARQFALATGSVPLIPPLPGFDQVAYFTADTIADNVRKLSHLVVIGGAPEAMELAQAFRRLGSAVTLVPQGELLPGFDRELAGLLLRAVREEGVVVLDGAEVTAIIPRSQGTGITLRQPNGEASLDVSHILVAMGRAPMLPADLLDKAGLRRDGDKLSVSPNGQTSSRRITAIGGAGGQHNPHLATLQATLLIERLLGESSGKLDPQNAPLLVGTDPPLAQVGLLKPAGSSTVLRSNFGENDAARALGLGRGAAKLVVGPNGALAGAGAVGPGAGEIVAMLALAMSVGLKAGELARLAVPEPSPAAALADLAGQYLAAQKPGGWRRRLLRAGR